MKFIAKLLITSIVIFTFHTNSFAWGRDGHRITGLLAEKSLTNTTKAKLKAMLGSMSLAEASTWMDEQRPKLLQMNQNTPLWHYNDAPVCGNAPLSTYCKDGNCASEKTKEFINVLSDSDRTPEERIDAVKFIVHMVGDIHQPLHSADNHDRGGNQLFVQLDTKRVKLHHAWDTELVALAQNGRSEQQFTEDLFTTYVSDVRDAQAGDIDTWIAESNVLALNHTYGELNGFACRSKMSSTIELDSKYKTSATNIIKLQLVRAGARIAYLLNAALDN